ncbi:MAG TPA: hypothetical protein VGL10_05305 [Gammaproteobacteria bacterium]
MKTVCRGATRMCASEIKPGRRKADKCLIFEARRRLAMRRAERKGQGWASNINNYKRQEFKWHRTTAGLANWWMISALDFL